MAYSSASISDENTFADAMGPLIGFSIFFGPGERFKNKFHSRLACLVFVMFFFGMHFVAVVGVFVRSTIDVWIQFSLYIVPLLALVNGFKIYRSTAFARLLNRPLGQRSQLTRFHQQDMERGMWYAETQQRSWLKRTAFKNCIYPLCLEFYQWTAYILFHTEYKSDAFAGEFHVNWFPISNKTWDVLYIFFWTFAMYFTGFVSYSFIMVSRLTVRDVISFMCAFGESPFLPTKPEPSSAFSKKVNPVLKAVKVFFGFFLFDLFEIGQEIVLVYEPDTHSTTLRPEINGTANQIIDLDKDDIHTDKTGSPGDSRQNSGSISVPYKSKLSPEEACMYLSNIIANIEGLASAFELFIALLSFFAVANLVTHIGAIVSARLVAYSETHWWTLVRTCIWLLVSLRLFYAVASVTRAFSRIKAHVEYLRSINKLQGEYKDWDKFFQLVETYQLGERTYGFPLTLKQAGSIAAFMNFTFLIALSIIKPSLSSKD